MRLLDPSAQDVRAVCRQLGPIQAPLDREPDIRIRFVDRLMTTGELRYVGVDAAYTDDAFLVLRGKHKAPVRVQVPFHELGGPCELVCERGLAALPLLVAVVNLTALARGVLPLHASAFTFEGNGVLATGWAKGGKTETLLAFAERGAHYVGDEWVYLCNGQAVGIPEPIRLWAWQLERLQAMRRRLAVGTRLRLRTLDAVGSLLQRSDPAAGSVARLGNLVSAQAYVQAPPHQLFGIDKIAPVGPVDVVLFVCSHAAPDIRVEPIDVRMVTRRMLASLEHERAELSAYERAFRFAFPDAAETFVREAPGRERELLGAALDGKPAYRVAHPYPVDIPALFDAIRPVLG